MPHEMTGVPGGRNAEEIKVGSGVFVRFAPDTPGSRVGAEVQSVTLEAAVPVEIAIRVDADVAQNYPVGNEIGVAPSASSQSVRFMLNVSSHERLPDGSVIIHATSREK